MLLALDLGNSSLTVGVYRGETLLFRSSLTAAGRQRDEIAVTLKGILSMYGVDPSEIDSTVMASVVPQGTAAVSGAVELLTGVRPLIVGPGVRTGLHLRLEQAGQLGADLVADAVGALSIVRPPLLVLDLGAATTLIAVNAASELTGVVIAPGVRSALDALSLTAAELPNVTLERPKRFLGRNTDDAMRSGSLYGSAFMLDGFLDRAAEELCPEGKDDVNILATGGLSDLVIPLCRRSGDIRCIPSLTLDGLRLIWQRNAANT